MMMTTAATAADRDRDFFVFFVCNRPVETLPRCHREGATLCAGPIETPLAAPARRSVRATGAFFIGSKRARASARTS